MNSIENQMANEIIKKISRLLDSEYIRQKIIEPIEKAAESFNIDTRASMTHKNFLKVIGDFVEHIYRYGLGFPKILSDSQACSEAVSIIEECYQSAESVGYFAAFLAARDSEVHGIEQVIWQIANHIIERESAKHIKWVFATKFYALDWQTQVLITQSLLSHWKHVLPSNLADWQGSLPVCS
jgi:predicted nucleotidyltransferase